MSKQASLLMASSTRLRLQEIHLKPPHAILLAAPEGAGKAAVAQWLAAQMLGLDYDTVLKYPQLHIFRPDDKHTISVEVARQIAQTLKLKTNGSRRIRRIVLVESAHALTIEAQNALLKTLEEPPADTVIILTATDQTALLPTIRSRVQAFPIDQPTIAQAQQFFGTQHSEADVQRAYLMSGGLPGLMSALLLDASHPLTEAISDVKSLLRADIFTRLQAVDEIHKNKQTDQLLFALTQIAQTALVLDAKSAKTPHISKSARRWMDILEQIQIAREQLKRNAQAKLVLTNLMLHL